MRVTENATTHITTRTKVKRRAKGEKNKKMRKLHEQHSTFHFPHFWNFVDAPFVSRTCAWNITAATIKNK
jgi:hypothetical protein